MMLNDPGQVRAEQRWHAERLHGAWPRTSNPTAGTATSTAARSASTATTASPASTAAAAEAAAPGPGVGQWWQHSDSTRTQPRPEGRCTVDTQSATVRFEAALSQQLALSADPAVESAGELLRQSLAAASQQLAMDLAQQAAAEVSGQLSGQHVEVVLRDGEPTLVVRAEESAPHAAPQESMEARLTLRLPSSLKDTVEQAASQAGDSVNSWVVKTLNSTASRPGGVGRRFSGTVRT